MSAELVSRLSRRIDDTYADVIPAGASVALLDVPTHTNIGDHAITLGELTALRRGRFELAHVSAAAQAPAGEVDVGDAVLLLHGGGNLGDLWPEHQRYREAILSRFAGRPVVQLPQSLSFEDGRTLAGAQRSFDAHPDFTLLVRDQEDFDFATGHFTCRVLLCPDSAFALGPIPRPVAASRAVVCLARYDHERTAEQEAAARSLDSVDWPRSFDRPERWMREVALKGTDRLARSQRSRPLTRTAANAAYHGLARRRVNRGLRMLAAGERVVTDRLHAHILSLLMNIPHAVADTRSNKVHGYIETWTASSSLVRMVPSLVQGLEDMRSYA